jgi:5-formyltetrahydrofolate cyclo-ligase
MTPERRREESLRACDRALSAGIFRGGSTVMLYAPVAGLAEIDLVPLADGLLDRGCRLCVPRVNWTDKTMVAALVANLTSGVVADPAGIRQGMKMAPPEAPVVDNRELDAVVVPGLGFDAAGGRIGRGAGFYDRFLAGLPSDRPVRVALSFDEQIVEEVPVEGHDAPIGVIVTPSRVIVARGGPKTR